MSKLIPNLFTFSAVHLNFQLFVYIFICLFTFSSYVVLIFLHFIFAGNKIVEDGEECDCGFDDQECQEQCCYPRQSSELNADENKQKRYFYQV